MKKRNLLNRVKQLAFSLCLILFLLLVSKESTDQALAQAEDPAWHNTAWVHRKIITIDHTQVDADLTNFPVLINLTSDSDLAAKAQDNGDDILFTDSDGTKLNHEIELFDGSNGQLIAWINVPVLSSTTDTILAMYYGNPSATNQENVAGVWDSDYVSVLHLSETSGTHYDSTVNGNTGTPQNGLIQDAIGKIGGADDFGGANEFIDVGTDPYMDIYRPSHDFSVFMWVKRDNIADTHGLFSSGSSAQYGI